MTPTPMSSRQRVTTALNHREPDRVPMDLTITIKPYRRLREYLGLPEREVRADNFTEVYPEPELLKRLGVDMTFIRLRPPAKWQAPPPSAEGVRFDEYGVGRKAIEIGPDLFLNEVVHSPLKEASLKDLAHYPWPDPSDPGRTAGLEQEARRLYEETDLAIMGRFGGPILELAAYMRGWENMWTDLLTQREFATTLLNILADIQIELDRRALEACGKYLAVFKLSGEDLGMQDRPLYSPKLWNEVILPVLGRRWRAARQVLDGVAPQVKLLLHSDGAIRMYLPDLIACGIDMIDPVQPDCPGMELEGLKRDFGDKLCFHGAVDTHQALPFGSVEDVEAETMKCMQALGKGGGYILAPVHNVQGDVPPENLMAMFRTVIERGEYSLGG
jgi:uroporphyrinogen decarboxylase